MEHAHSEALVSPMRWFCFALLALAASVQAREVAFPPAWTAPTEPFAIFDDVYWVGTRGLGAFLFTSPEGHILVDVGMPQSVGDVVASIERLGFSVQDVRYLLNTQAHFDHSGGLAEFKALSGAEMLASAGDRYALEAGVYEGWESRPYFDFPALQVDRVIEDGDEVRVGDVVLTAMLTPGHSPGCTSWAFEARDGDARHSALLFCSASVAANRLAPNPQYPGIVDDFRATFRRMALLEVDAWLAPHAEQFDLDAKRARLGTSPHPFVDPEEKARRMAVFEADFARALAAQTGATED